jgi:AmmeMemoRadiSam system protein B
VSGEEFDLLRRVYEAERQRRDAAFKALPSRPAFHAGKGYPRDPEQARAFLDALLALAPETEPQPLSRLIAPHIDLRLGAEVYAHAHRRLANSPRPDLVVLLGVCHAFTHRRFIACRKDFETPLGRVRHDAAFLDALEREVGESIEIDVGLHYEEHSIEFQALWLAHLWSEDPPAIAPILLGSVEDLIRDGDSPSGDEELEHLIDALRRCIDEESRRVVVIASVDLAHIGPVYDHPAGLDERGEAALRAADLSLLESVAAGDAEGFFDLLALEENARQVCGTAPIYVTLRLGEGAGELLRYGQGRIHPESGSVVSFAAVGFPR